MDLFHNDLSLYSILSSNVPSAGVPSSFLNITLRVVNVPNQANKTIPPI